MVEYKRRLLWASLLVTVVSISFASSRQRLKGVGSQDNAGLAATQLPQASLNTLPPTPHRNLSLQPEAYKLSRILGKRFHGPQRKASLLVGTLTVNGAPVSISIERQQGARGESLTVRRLLNPEVLTWDETNGAKSSGTLGTAEREVIERLCFDSVDQFVLAQLRGASYTRVAQNVRLAKADSENDTGPLWDVIRVDGPVSGETKPASTWRLYYINTKTGLIDRIVSEVADHRIEATLSQWQEQSGERFPTRIIWTSDGQRVMSLTLTSLSLSTAMEAMK